jgi:hypothetical protein
MTCSMLEACSISQAHFFAEGSNESKDNYTRTEVVFLDQTKPQHDAC